MEFECESKTVNRIGFVGSRSLQIQSISKIIINLSFS